MPAPLLTAIGTFASGVASVGSLVTTLNTADRTPPPIVVGPEPPARDEPAVEATRRRVLTTRASQGRRSTIIAGAAREGLTPQTQKATLLGG